MYHHIPEHNIKSLLNVWQHREILHLTLLKLYMHLHKVLENYKHMYEAPRHLKVKRFFFYICHPISKNMSSLKKVKEQCINQLQIFLGKEGGLETISGWWWGSSEWVITGHQWVQVKCCLVKWNGVDVALFIIGPLWNLPIDTYLL